MIVVMSMFASNVDYIKVCIKERLKAADFKPSVCNLSDERVEAVILNCLCDHDSEEHYLKHIQKLKDQFTDFTNEQPQNHADVDRMATVFHKVFCAGCDHEGKLVAELKTYINSKTLTDKGYNSDKIRNHRRTHIKIIHELLNFGKGIDRSVLLQLLSLACCLLIFCHKTKTNISLSELTTYGNFLAIWLLHFFCL